LKVELTGSTSSGEMAFSCLGLFKVTTLTCSISSPTTTLTSKSTTIYVLFLTTLSYLSTSCRNPFLAVGSNYKHNYQRRTTMAKENETDPSKQK